MILLTGAKVVTPGGVLDPGRVLVRDGLIAQVGRGDLDLDPGRAEPAERVDLTGAWLLPGFVDLHMHGGGGHDVAASAADMAGAVAFHQAHGTTRTLVSLVTAPVARLAEQLGWVAALTAAGPGPDGHVVGAHLEGPFLAAERRGAQPAEHLRRPDRAVFADLEAAAAGALRVITVAPELPGAAAVVAAALEAGAVAAAGHTDATYAQASAAFAAGITLTTHVFNGMRPLHHREPGTAGAALDAGVACELINDGVHVHPALLRLVAAEPERLVLVTDAVDAAGAGDGEYVLGGHPVRVRDGQARLVAGGALAGSTLTMDQAVRRAVAAGLPIEVVAAAAATNPARVLGLDARCGAIAPGLDADLVVLDAELAVTAVMAGGRWVGGRGAPRSGGG
ncbi:N-acetylglucosamine-6-phosphate deacetylase [Parafrankia colletiae]|uniref:N-acetylglucosamine-6-phosphate deacetylase n=1 Tax=Parafrankia colletiae TaxID=573497 RepID=A0A1S1R9A3_9ACTN|nr:N-acetylglucosamine-6-phosphate deacetylase [Parafrankia colletiae]MCK9900714.1 N-acetylglucosamine-6-phosphate deacetylase [Frankia sp. Cpl3]OHV42329.1 N-acetylglucosamine-6-phosphate deacetylase [Parafrankia colletiae]